ncbi:cell division protein ZipA [Shewanella donghaensis]|uniref:cell division protein ZipA n=1 Tax=Shewanella donghaensis TaxID=238836 RepID=UPI001183A7DD|nr:cell division protein ZipA [Shewanella donghaensis]
MEDFQLVLSILGAIAIIAVLVHGFWSIRKQQPKTLKDNPMTGFYKGQANQRDSQGFDADGIGEVRRVNADDDSQDDSGTPSSTPNMYRPKAAVNSTISDDVEINEAGSKKGIGLQNPSAINAKAPSYHPGRKEPVMAAAAIKAEAEHMPTQQALFTEDFTDEYNQEPVETAHVDTSVNTVDASASDTTYQQADYQHHKDTHNQEPVIAAEATFAATSVTETPEPVVKDEPLGDPQDVLVLHVVARDGEQMHGAELLPCLLSLNFKFGDMDIFHRHQDNAGNGKVLFSMANMLKPGVFDPDSMEQFVTQGVVLFMTLPCHGDALMNFSIMLNSAQQLADDLGAEVLDDKRLAWTDVNKQAYLSRIKAVS